MILSFRYYVPLQTALGLHLNKLEFFLLKSALFGYHWPGSSEEEVENGRYSW